MSKAAPTYAIEAAAGLSAVEEGDDRLRPGLSLHVAPNEFYAGRFHYYGREFGPVTEETYIISAMRRWPLFKSNAITAAFGLAVMNERTELDFGGADADHEKTENNFNVGAALGIAWSLPPTAGPVYASVSWDSHVFPAGIGGILLSTGRKQTISLLVGTRLK